MTPGGEPTSDLLTELEQYRRLFNNIPAEIGVFDPAGRFLFNTPSGIRDPAVRQWVLGKTHHDFCRERKYPMAIADKRQSVIEQCVAEKKTVVFEEVWTDKRGRRRNYVRTFSPVLDADGNVTHVLGYGQEITDLKRVEEELRVALAEVEALKDRLHAENLYLQEELKSQHNFEEIVGRSAAMQSVLAAIATVAPTQANVVITGETGTGKELVARAVHALSPRKDKPLIKVNCASIPRELFESEFFGHVRGAFTGAIRDRVGRFQLADQGTLFLDEVGEIPLEMQSKLLRVIQEGEFERVGEERTRTVDVRLITATNRNLKQEVEAGRFRQDLYYRLNVFPIEVAPLRHRKDDIPLLASHYIEQISRRLNRSVPALTTHDVRRLQAYEWPGNVRELHNVVERALITMRGPHLVFDLPNAGTRQVMNVGASNAEADDAAVAVIPEVEMRRQERANVLRALRRTNWRVYGARWSCGAAERQADDAKLADQENGAPERVTLTVGGVSSSASSQGNGQGVSALHEGIPDARGSSSMNMIMYRGYIGQVTLDEEAGLLHGQVPNTRDVITFQGRSVRELHKALKHSVDDYIAFCAERGEDPDKPLSGRFVLRIDPALHREVTIAAAREGKSLNKWVAERLEREVVESGSKGSR